MRLFFWIKFRISLMQMINFEPNTTMSKGKILVMDDEKQIRHIISMMLDRLNYKVEVAGDGSEAILLFKSAIAISEPFNAVIMDLKVADGMGGDEGIKRLLEIDEDAKIILCSGCISDQIMLDYREYGISAIIEKPFKMADLSNMLQKLILKCQ